MPSPLFAGFPRWMALTVALSAAFLIAYGIAALVARLARAALVGVVGRGATSTTDPLVNRPVVIVRRTIFLLAALVLIVPALELAGYRLRAGRHPEALLAWLLESGVRILVIAAVAWLLMRVIANMLVRLEREIGVSTGLDAVERAKRIRTLGKLVQSVADVLIVSTALLMVLHELRVDVLPLLTGAGIVGLAIGFGAQTLVKDVIAGFFLILENQVRVGDVAAINGTGGLVEAITLRTVVLRDVEGAVHVFPNGSIDKLANRSKDFSYAVVDIGVSYREDTDRVVDVLREVGEELRQDPALQATILEPLEVLGIEAFGESAVVLRVRAKTLPLRQWDVAREFRRRVKHAFDARGIEMPTPQRTVVVQRTPARP